MRRVLILVHRHGTLFRMKYYMREMAMVLKEQGIDVKVARGPGPVIDADVVVQHVDLTTVPDDHMEYLPHYPLVLNRKVSDISKRHISRMRLNPGDQHEGKVIVKANRNCGGRPEVMLARQGWLPGRHRLFTDYKVLDSTRDVSPEIWADPDLVVERFEPELVDGVYRLRLWKFCGNAETNTITYSSEPIVKGSNTYFREDSGEVPKELREIREELGYDYGKFDYGIVDGKLKFYDANKTPTHSQPMDQEMPRIRAFAEGLKQYFR